MRSILLVATLFVVPALDARANLYKCAGKDGKVTYQAEPCAAAETEKRIKAPPPGGGGAAAPKAGDGWDPKVLEKMLEGCVREANAGARRGWAASGDKRPYPEAQATREVQSHCECVIGRVRAVPYATFAPDAAAHLTRFANDAANGGQCKITITP